VDFQTTVIVFIIFAGSLTRATFGFGEAIVAMPLLAMVVDDTSVAAALVAVTSIFNASVILSTQWRCVEWRGAWRLVLAALVGIPFGVYALKHFPENAVKLILALIVLSFGGYNLVRPPMCRLKSDLLGYAFGLISGILGGAYNAFGPPLVIYGTLRGWGAQRFRSTLQAVFLPASLFVGLNHFLQGLWTREVILLVPFCLPAMMVAALLGHWLSERFDGQRFTRYVYWLLLVVGGMLLSTVLASVAGSVSS
jgi:hypothetical protein